MRLIYSILITCALPFITLKLLLRSFSNKGYIYGIPQRFAFNIPNKHGVIWIHAVSVGETIAIKPMVDKLIRDRRQILITSTTPTGKEQVIKLFSKNVISIYLPYDSPFLVKRFLKQVSPKIAIFVETEVWPNYLHYCKQLNISTALINARMSAKSFQGYSNLKSFAYNTFTNFNIIISQSNIETNLFQLLGAKNVVTIPSMKFDFNFNMAEIGLQADYIREKAGNNYSNELDGYKIILAASTHAGEEDIILNVFCKLKAKYKNLLLMIAPRHPERSNSVVNCGIRAGLNTKKYFESAFSHDYNVQVYIIDGLGVLNNFYKACDIAIVCGSFVKHGGHNILEPIALQKPVITGQYMFNFQNIINDLQNIAAIKVTYDDEQLYRTIANLLENTETTNTMTKRAYNYFLSNQGATEKTLKLLNLQQNA